MDADTSLGAPYDANAQFDEDDSDSRSSAPVLSPEFKGRGKVPSFVRKLYAIVNDTTTTDIVSWVPPHNSSFIIYHPDEFVKKVLPRYFKHAHYPSFIRQLNLYGFHRAEGREPRHFFHPSFKAGGTAALKDIRRKTSATSPSEYRHDEALAPPSNLSSTSPASMDESTTESEAAKLSEARRLLEVYVQTQAKIEHMKRLLQQADSCSTPPVLQWPVVLSSPSAPKIEIPQYCWSKAEQSSMSAPLATQPMFRSLGTLDLGVPDSSFSSSFEYSNIPTITLVPSGTH